MPSPQLTAAKGSKRPWRSTATVSCFTAAVGLCIAYAFYTIFSRFQLYDDEGFILISLKWFFGGHALYDEVYSCYQPGFYVLNWLIFGLWGAPLCHDSIRLVTLVFWMGGAGLNALITYRMTRSALLSLLVLILSTRCLDAFANEPGHPEALCYLLVAGLAALLTFELRPRTMALAAGTLIGALLLIKINIGGFALLAFLLVLACANPHGRLTWVKGVVAVSIILAPVVVMHSRWTLRDAPLPGLYVMEGAALLLIVFALFPRRGSWIGAVLLLLVCAASLSLVDTRLLASLPFFSAWLLTFSICSAAMICLALAPQTGTCEPSWIWAAAGTGSTVGSILIILLLRGTSLHGLLQGLFSIPATVSQSAFVPWQSSVLGAWFALAGAFTCLLFVKGRLGAECTSPPGSLLTIAKLVFGVLVLFEFYVRQQGSRPLMPFDYRLPHFWMLPFAWLAAVGGPCAMAQKARDSARFRDQAVARGFAGASLVGEVSAGSCINESACRAGRRSLVAIAVMQSLIAYPVAGTQLVPASMLLAVVAAVCLGDAAAEIVPKLRGFCVWPLRCALGSVVALLLVAFIARETKTAARNYAALSPLNLPGAKRVHLPPDQVRALQQLVEPLARPEVETFLTLPGLNSFYFWAEKEAPTGFNAAWMLPLEAEAQEKVWEAARQRRGLMVVRNRSLVRHWTKNRSAEQLPLVKYIQDQFQTVLTNGTYEVMIPRAAPNPAP